ncbi:MAG: hypothetical protein QM770_00110 [Tepidisphaeraceae bacterium]
MPLRLRPTFTIDLPDQCSAVTERLRAGLERQPVWAKSARLPGARADRPCDGTFVWVAMPAGQQKFFSPWLQLCIQSTDTGTQLFGRFSPKPEVWTAFALAYLFLSCVTFFSGMLGLVLLNLGDTPWPLWITACSVIGIIAMYVASQTGKTLADEQMDAIRSAVDHALALVPAPVEPMTMTPALA